MLIIYKFGITLKNFILMVNLLMMIVIQHMLMKRGDYVGECYLVMVKARIIQVFLFFNICIFYLQYSKPLKYSCDITWRLVTFHFNEYKLIVI